MKNKARNNIIKKTNKITSSVWTTTKQKKILFQKITHKNLANKSVEKNTIFPTPDVVNLIIILLMMHYSSYVLYDMKNETKKGKSNILHVISSKKKKIPSLEATVTPFENFCLEKVTLII